MKGNEEMATCKHIFITDVFLRWAARKSESVNSDGKKTITMWVHISDENEEGKVYKKTGRSLQ